MKPPAMESFSNKSTKNADWKGVSNSRTSSPTTLRSHPKDRQQSINARLSGLILVSSTKLRIVSLSCFSEYGNVVIKNLIHAHFNAFRFSSRLPCVQAR